MFPLPGNSSATRRYYIQRYPKEIRAKLIDYWNHRQSWQGVETKFLPHKQFECVCEKELLPAAPSKPDGEKNLLPILKSLGFEMRKCFIESDS